MWALWASLLVATLCHGSSLSPEVAMVPSPALGRPIPALNIPARTPLPRLPVLNGTVLLDMNAARITGPGDNSSLDDPYVVFTGRIYNEELVAGMIRVQQGSVLRMRVCNSLPATADTINSSFNYNTTYFPFGAGQSYREPNIAAHHFHGHYGNPGTDNVPCDPPAPAGVTCYRGDNIFANIMPGTCNEYQYDVSPYNSPGLFWMHPHHQGSSSLQAQSCSIPVVIDHTPGVGWDYLNTSSCQPYQRLFTADNEVVMHMQTFTMRVNYNESNGLPDPTGGPTDDGYIAVAVKSVPQDPLCCTGPNVTDDGATWHYVGGDDSVGNDFDPTITKEPFYSSGFNDEFVIINGVYNPTIAMQAGKVYRWRMVQASTMKWMDLSLNASGCTWGVYARDGILLRELPRMTDHIVLSNANRVELFITCEPGIYSLQTGQGPLAADPACLSSHCELLQQPNLATLVVTAALGNFPINAAAPFGPAQPCMPQYPPYLSDLRGVPASVDSATHIAYTGLLNFTNKDPTGPPSGNCLVNSLIYNEGQPLQETIGEVMQLDVENIDVHPYHHHTQPYQIVALANDSDALDSTWRVGDYVDTLLLPSSGMKRATVRWVPGPVEITGTGYALLHCHIFPHSDEGCILKTQILDKTYMKMRTGMSDGAKAGITLAALVGFCCLVVAPIMVLKRRKKLRALAQQEARLKLVDPEAVHQYP